MMGYWRFKGMMFVRVWAAVVLLSLAVPAGLGTVQAQPAETQAIQFDIPPGPLAPALSRFAELTHLQLVYSSDVVAGTKTTGLSGSFTANAALGRLLAGTGLLSRMVSPNTATIEKIDAKGAKVLGPIQVEGVRTAGANGSTDPTATEGTGSYTSGALTIGSKMPLSMRETPQSVSVITQQRIRDQILTDLNSALNQATGISLLTSSSVQATFSSRGFQIGNFQFDGGAPLNYGTFGNLVQIDMAEYDHVELLRGADGMFAGAGDPGGTVNLVRKRPLDHNQVLFEGGVGSWNNYRTMLDVTGPLALDGKVRGRAVMTYQDQDYFYRTANNNHVLLYGVVETDVTPSTLLTLGGSFTRQKTIPWFTGLPRYQTGADLQLPRSTCLCTDWSRWNFSTPEIFVKLDQRIDEDWSIKLNLDDTWQTSNQKYGSSSGTVNPNTLTGPTLSGLQSRQTTYSTRQYLADITVNGAFDLFSRHHEIVVGANWQDVDAGGQYNFPSLSYALTNPAVDVFNFNPAAYPEPASAAPSSRYPVLGQEQYGAYTTLRLQLLDSLHLIGGFRLSGYRNERVTQNLNPDGSAKGSPTISRYSDNGVITPYGGLVYDVTDIWSLYANYTDIFKSQANELQGPLPGTPLPPVKGSEYEAGVKGELFDGGLNTSLALYRISQENAFVSDPNFPSTPGSNGSSCCFLPIGNIKSEGVDAEATGQILPHWQIFAGYTYNFNRTLTPGSTAGQAFASRAPEHLLKLWTTYQLSDDLSQWELSTGINAQSSSYNSGSVCAVYSSPTVCKTSIPYNFTQGGYALFSARISYRANDHWDAAFNVNNILDKTYYQTMGSSAANNWYGDPRNVMFTIRYLN